MAKHSIIAYLYPKRAVFLLAFLVIAPLCHADQPAPPEAASEIQSSISSVRGVGGVCVTANPLATQACQAALAQGGSAADAALAAAWMLGLVEPQSSGLGGGGYLVYFDGQQVYSFDGRETAPRLAHPRRF
ncbi:MAG: gamma-glutamyltransferase, partial [Pseudomonadota bacterium]|nr:gamma-glutamyltransferase [Pseudomonadota bacterium]